MTEMFFFNFYVRGVGNTEEDFFTGKVIAYIRPIQYKGVQRFILVDLFTYFLT